MINDYCDGKDCSKGWVENGYNFWLDLVIWSAVICIYDKDITLGV